SSSSLLCLDQRLRSERGGLVQIFLNGDVLFGTRLICVTRGVDEPYEASVPGFTKAILASGDAMLDGCEIVSIPRVVKTEEDVRDLVALLELPGRQGEVIVFSLPDGSTNVEETIAASNEICERLRGVANVFVLTGPASFYLTDYVGKELSVFRQAVRVYRPGFISWVSQPSDHPLILPSRVRDWDGGALSFQRWLVHHSLLASVRGRRREEILPPFDRVRQMAAQTERQNLKDAGGTDAELIRLYEQDNERLVSELREQRELHSGLLEAAEEERDAAIQDANAAKSQSLERLHRIRVLEAKLSEVIGSTEQVIPVSLDEFESWCHDNLAGAVELAGRAFQGVRKSEYHDPQMIYRSLLLLRDFYVPMRIDSTPNRRDAYEAALRELHLEESHTGDGVKYAADLYSVQYGSRRVPLDRHLKGGDSRDRRYCFRVYFFWDEEGQVAVVGWLPSHLDNRAS
ncbi:MAG: hypothetical protein K2X00_22975, partial [Nitrospiraceae bacterium]|nr:hypothetical protein [Nitrospiraceae bacterium]